MKYPDCKTMKGYSTKYALTQGIQHVTVRAPHDDDGKSKYVYTNDAWPTQLVIGRNFFTEKKDAEESARKMARAKVASLKKSLKKMQALVKDPQWAS